MSGTYYLGKDMKVDLSYILFWRTKIPELILPLVDRRKTCRRESHTRPYFYISVLFTQPFHAHVIHVPQKVKYFLRRRWILAYLHRCLPGAAKCSTDRARSWISEDGFNMKPSPKSRKKMYPGGFLVYLVLCSCGRLGCCEWTPKKTFRSCRAVNPATK